MTTFDLLVRGGTIVSHRGIGIGDVGITNGAIVSVGDLDPLRASKVFDASGLHILPGIIDTQVHFREPGMEAAEDLESGTRGAVLGGVTGVFEMPNTWPPTTSADALNDKLARAKNRAWCNYAFYLGGTDSNSNELGELERLPGCCGIKVFMGASTGDLLVPDDAALKRILSNGNRRVAVHSEDNQRIEDRKDRRGTSVLNHPVWRDELVAMQATQRLIEIAREHHRRVHVLHITTAEEIDFLSKHKDIASVELTPQHLTFISPDCYRDLGTLAQMNPPIRSISHRDALWRAVDNGVVDIIGSDHAPHTLDSKKQDYPNSPSGMTGVQTTVPVMLNHVAEGRLSLSTIIDLMCEGPQRIFGLIKKGRIAVGYDADLTIVDIGAKRVIEDSWIVSKAGWSPYNGQEVTGWPVATIIDGTIVMQEDELLSPAVGKPFRFQEVAYT